MTAPIARKRKEREDFFTHTINGSGNARGKTANPPYPSHPNTTSLKHKKPSEPVSSNRLLAGYLAHEFLTQGSLLGHKFDPARVEAVPSSSPTELIKSKPDPSLAADPISVGSSAAGGAERTVSAMPKKSYAEVARILKGDGAHISGIVNPTQLARWIQM